ncbi:putative exported protein [plant metagenome]|uniref:Putative exported protein n=2 Tax=plant metagenome TaxID=1297885 RepID=A0A484XE20_9ZZZZ
MPPMRPLSPFPRRLARRLTHLVGLALASILATSAAAQAAPKSLAPLTVGLSVRPSVADGGVWLLAQELGLWTAAGLQVRTVEFEGAGLLVPQVAAGKIDIGLPSPETILSATAAGQSGLGLTFFYNAVPANAMEFAVLADSPIHRVSDLKGRKIGVGALTWGNIPSTRAILRDAGVAAGDYSIVPVGVLGAGFHALTSGRVDALNYNAGWHDILELSGTPLRRIRMPGVFGEMSVNAFVTRSDALARDPDRYARFGRAYTQALLACQADIERCVTVYWQANPQARPAAGTNPDKALADAKEVVRRRLQRILLHPDGSPREPGRFDVAVIRQYVQRMAEAGEFASADVPVETLFSNALVPAFSGPDAQPAGPRAQARP